MERRDEMNIIHRRDVIRDVRRRYVAQYPERYVFLDGSTSTDTLKALDALDLKTCSAEAVNEAIGNPSWTVLNCDECDENVPMVLRIGDEPGHDARWRDLCSACVARAVALISETTLKP
jgi:hypothetical protein